MEYITIRRVNEENFVSALNKAVAEGVRVVSTGASFNQQARCLEWWAIAEKPGEAQDAPEAKKDERAELLEAAQKIKAACGETDFCRGCPFNNGNACGISAEFPCDWHV